MLLDLSAAAGREGGRRQFFGGLALARLGVLPHGCVVVCTARQVRSLFWLVEKRSWDRRKEIVVCVYKRQMCGKIWKLLDLFSDSRSQGRGFVGIRIFQFHGNCSRTSVYVNIALEFFISGSRFHAVHSRCPTGFFLTVERPCHSRVHFYLRSTLAREEFIAQILSSKFQEPIAQI